MTDLTQRQIAQLQALNRAGATDSVNALGADDPILGVCEPMVLGRLRAAGLVNSRTVKIAGFGQRTVYWLTTAGLFAVRMLATPGAAATAGEAQAAAGADA